MIEDDGDPSLVHHIKGLCRQIAGNLASNRKHPAVFDQLSQMVERDFGPRLTPVEREAIWVFLRRYTNT